MRDSQELVESALAGIPEQESAVGVFVSQDGPVATVDVAGKRLLVKAAGAAVRPGDAVRLERRGAAMVMLGATRARSALGRVTVAGNPATVEYPDGSGVTAQLPVAAGMTVAVADHVVIDWDSYGTIIAKVSAPSSPVVPGAPSGAGRQQVTQTFTAIDSGSFHSSYGWWTGDVIASTSNVGCWFYGAKIKDTIPDQATILSASIYLPARQNVYGPPLLGVHPNGWKPPGNPGLNGLGVLDPDQGQVPIPTAWIDLFKVGDGGVGVAQGGSYNIYSAVGADGNSGAITVVYLA